MTGIREEAIKELVCGGVLVAPKVRHIEQEVVPWLMDKIVDFLHEDKAAIKGSYDVVEGGLEDAQNIHQDVIKARYAAIEQAKQDEIEAAKARVQRKKDRRLAREIRAKDLELEKYKDQI